MSDPQAQEAFGRAAELALELLPELDFLRIDGSLRVDVGPTPIHGIRLDLRTGQPLHLRSVTVAGVSAQPAAVVTASGWSDAPVEAADLMDDDPAEDAEHVTNAAEHTWLELTWDDGVPADGVLLRNVRSQWCHRGSGVVVSVRVPSGAWCTVFDGAARVEAARQSVLARAREEYEEEQLVALMGCVFATAVGEYHDARMTVASFKRKMSDDRRAALKAVVNPTFLHERDREWTAHGPNRSFRYWSTQEKQVYLASAAELAADLRELTPRVCFGFGAALAVERDRDLIPHDDDLDLIIAFGSDEAITLEDGLARVEVHLRSLGYEVLGTGFAHRQAGRPGAKRVDVFVGLFDHGTRWWNRRRIGRTAVAWYPGPRDVLTVSDVFPASYQTVLGVEVPMPRSPERYLRTQYGASWRVPDPGFRHRWARAPYGDIGQIPGVAPKKTPS